MSRRSERAIRGSGTGVPPVIADKASVAAVSESVMRVAHVTP